MKYIVLFIALAAAGCCEAYGQLYPERKHIRSGNKDYEKLDYGAAEGDYRAAAAKNPASFGASFNLGDALYKQERFEEAENTFSGLLENTLMTQQQAAKAYHNLGNAQFAQQKLKEAEESYMRSLALNPDDLETKYNLAYVQKLLEEQQGGGDGDGQDDQNQDGNDNQDQQNNPDGQNGDNDPQEGDRDQDQDGKQDQQDQEQQEKPEAREQREGAISKEDAAKMLESMQQQEDKTRDKVNEKQATATTKSGKNW